MKDMQNLLKEGKNLAIDALKIVVRETADEFLSGGDHIYIIEPLDVLDFHNFLSRNYLILTEFGGIREKASAFGKLAPVMRDTTERPKDIVVGTLKLVGVEKEAICNEFSRLLPTRKSMRQ